MDFIIFALARWDSVYSSTAFSLAKSLSENHRVFYIDNPHTYFSLAKDWCKPALAHRKKVWFGKRSFIHKPLTKVPNFHAVVAPLVFPINMLPPGKLYTLFYQLNNRLLERRVKKLCALENITDPVFINIFNPFYLPKLSAVTTALNIYYTVDAIEASEYIQKHGPRLENVAIQKANFALATSKKLQQSKQHLNTVHYLPNAADIALFSKARNKVLEKPKSMQALAGEILIYTGNISIREDFDLLEKIAERYPKRNLLLVGPVNTKNHQEQRLQKYPNIHFAGRQDLETLPAFLQHADCALIPFKCNALTEGIYPLKINEYLASGIPVVSTAFSADIRDFSPVAYLADNHEEFLQKIETAIAENSIKKAAERAAFAKSNTWQARAEQLLALVRASLSQ